LLAAAKPKLTAEILVHTKALAFEGFFIAPRIAN
jgi:hypothetical protein